MATELVAGAEAKHWALTRYSISTLLFWNQWLQFDYSVPRFEDEDNFPRTALMRHGTSFPLGCGALLRAWKELNWKSRTRVPRHTNIYL